MSVVVLSVIKEVQQMQLKLLSWSLPRLIRVDDCYI